MIFDFENPENTCRKGPSTRNSTLVTKVIKSSFLDMCDTVSKKIQVNITSGKLQTDYVAPRIRLVIEEDDAESVFLPLSGEKQKNAIALLKQKQKEEIQALKEKALRDKAQEKANAAFQKERAALQKAQEKAIAAQQKEKAAIQKAKAAQDKEREKAKAAQEKEKLKLKKDAQKQAEKIIKEQEKHHKAMMKEMIKANNAILKATKKKALIGKKGKK
jgi:flagellar biosynthesis GTPase FlhF